MLYWAYGSNLNPAGMRMRCPRAKRVGRLILDGYLVFRGVADVIGTDDDHKVPGGLWRISRDCERSLDVYEGVSSGLYRKKYFTVSVNGGEPERVLYYQMNAKRLGYGIQPPSDHYLRTIERGYEWFGLDLNYLAEALDHAWGGKKLTGPLRERYIRKGRPRLAPAGSIELSVPDNAA